MTNAIATFSKELDKKLVVPLQAVLKGRKLVYTTEAKGFGISAVEWGTIRDVSEGHVSYGFTTGNVDSIDVELENAKVPVYWKDYIIDRRAYEGWLYRGIDIDAASAISAGYKAGQAVDTAVIYGISRQDSSTFDFKGLYQGAGNDYSTSKDFGTYGNAIAAVAGGLALIAADGVPTDSLPYNLTLSPTQYQKVIGSMSTAGIWEIDVLTKILNGGNIYQSTALPNGKGLLSPAPEVGEPYVDFFLTQDFKTDNGVDSKNPETSDIFGRVFSAGVLRIKQADALCKLSNLA